MKISYIFPSRSRPDKFFCCLDNIQNLSSSNNYEIIASLDLDDKTMNNIYVKERLLQYKNVKPFYSTSTGKVNAINRETSNISGDAKIICCMSDDFEFLVKGFDEKIVSDMNEFFPDTDGFLHYPDGSPAKDILCTMSIVGRKYFERFGYIYHKDYMSVYCDNEATSVAKILKKYKFINTQLASHNHPIWKKSEFDDLYRKNENSVMYATDGATYLRRKKNNFDL